MTYDQTKSILEAQVQAQSAHNDGYTRQFYAEQAAKLEAKVQEDIAAKNESEQEHERRMTVASVNSEAMFADGFDDAIIGYDVNGCAIYDYDKCLNILVEQDMTREEAHEYMEFNVVNTYVGDFTPIFMHGFFTIEE